MGSLDVCRFKDFDSSALVTLATLISLLGPFDIRCIKDIDSSALVTLLTLFFLIILMGEDTIQGTCFWSYHVITDGCILPYLGFIRTHQCVYLYDFTTKRTSVEEVYVLIKHKIL